MQIKAERARGGGTGRGGCPRSTRSSAVEFPEAVELCALAGQPLLRQCLCRLRTILLQSALLHPGAQGGVILVRPAKMELTCCQILRLLRRD